MAEQDEAVRICDHCNGNGCEVCFGTGQTATPPAVPAAPHFHRRRVSEHSTAEYEQECSRVHAVPAAPPLDVGRLARAIYESVDRQRWYLTLVGETEMGDVAQLLAAEYARLSPDQEDGDAPK